MDYKLLATLFIGIMTITIASIASFKIAKQKFEFKSESEFNSMLTKILTESFSDNSLSKVTQEIVVILKSYYKIDYITILILNKATKLRVISSNVQSEHLDRVEQYCNKQLKDMGNSIVKVDISENGALSHEVAQLRDIRFSLFAPLIFKDKVMGAILIEDRDVGKVEKEKMREEIYGKIFKSTAVVLQNIIHTEKLVTMVSTDQLTGVYNRRYMDYTLSEEVNMHKNLGLQLNVVLLDIDHFKKFNDTYGHQFGDLVLRYVSKYIQKNIGSKAWIARYGGEEFLISFGRSNQAEVFKKIDEIRKGIAKLVLTDGESEASVTVSFGIATFPIHGATSEKLIEKADDALYESKNAGRNRVTIASN